MRTASYLMEYEKAFEYKKTIDSIKTTTNKQKINLKNPINNDKVSYK